MTWQNRTREAACVDPAGNRYVFLYEDLQLVVRKKTTAYEFLGVEGTYIQDRGVAGRKFPLRLYFSGSDYDETADAFTNSLALSGSWRLEHPVYGDVTVIPFDEITRDDRRKLDANQAVFDIVFWETTASAFPESSPDRASLTQAADEDANEAALGEFSLIPLDTESARVFAREQYRQVFENDILQQLLAITQTEDSRNQVNAIATSITEGLPTAFDDPETLAAQTGLIVRTPTADGSTPLAFTGLLASLSVEVTEAQAFQVRDLFAQSLISAGALAALSFEYPTRGAAVADAQGLLQAFEDWVAWRDLRFEEIGINDPGVAHQAVQDTVVAAAAYLIEQSFALPQEVVLVLTRSRVLLELVAELYGETDERIDFFIDTNELSTTEILLIPEGRRIVYYI